MNRVVVMRVAREAKRATREVLARWATGGLGAEQQAVAAEGARRFWDALATGDIAEDATYEVRIATCKGCGSKRDVAAPGMKETSSWCGMPFENRMGDESPTCGCLLGVKCLVGSEKCPQRKW